MTCCVCLAITEAPLRAAIFSVTGWCQRVRCGRIGRPAVLAERRPTVCPRGALHQVAKR